jgi:SAM-dependent methyltransferase
MTGHETKKNVEQFNEDVHRNNGYLYTTNAPYSAVVANKRINQAVISKIPSNCKRFIDIGCGDGVNTDLIAKRFPHIYVEGNDPVENAINSANALFPHIKFKISNILTDSDIPETMFDVGLLRGVVHHLPDESQVTALQHARLFVNTLIIVEPNGNNPILKLIEKRSAYHIAHEEQSFTTETLTAWCKDAGWKHVDVDYIGFVPFFFPDFLARAIYIVQPVLERIPVLNKYFSAQIVLTCRS